MKTLYFDVDTQLDFLYPAGALYVPGAERIVPTIARLNRYAAAHGIPVVSTTDAHSEDDVEFAQWPPHCVAGTIGQHKAEATLLEGRVVVPNRECELALEGARQIVVEKQHVDVFTARRLSRIVEWLAADRFVVYGVVTEICVLFAAPISRSVSSSRATWSSASSRPLPPTSSWCRTTMAPSVSAGAW